MQNNILMFVLFFFASTQLHWSMGVRLSTKHDWFIEVQNPIDSRLITEAQRIMNTDYEGAFHDSSKMHTYHYNPFYDTAVCACAKCGSTALYLFIYSKIFGHSWNFTGSPWVQGVSSIRWENQFVQINAEKLRKVKKKFAVMRDPKERLISSWKSKVACGSEWGLDPDKNYFVTELRSLAGLSYATCLNFLEFLKTLQVVHQSGQANKLNSHFLPQHFSCFRDVKPNEWSKAAFLSDQVFVSGLSQSFGDYATHKLNRSHGSSLSFTIGEQENIILNEVTQEEYEALGLSVRRDH